MSLAETKSKFRPSSRWDLAKEVREKRLSDRDIRFFLNCFNHKHVSTAMQAALEVPGMVERIQAYQKTPRAERNNPPWTSVTASLRPLKLPPNSYLLASERQKLFNANYVPLAFNLSAKGLDELVDRHLITREGVALYRKLYRNSNDYLHEAMTSYASAMADLACRHRPELEFLSGHQALSRACADTLAADNPLAIALEDRRATVPDTLFGIRKAGKVSWFAVEADRNTEHLTVFRRKLRKYRELIGSKLYTERYGIGNLQVLILTTNTTHMHNLIADLETECDRDDGDDLCGPRPFLFKAIPELRTGVNEQPINYGFLDGWQGVDREGVSLA